MVTLASSKGPAVSLPVQQDGLCTTLAKVTRKASKTWDHSQIGHRSEYSIERLLAFRDYYERTSNVRAILVCAVTPIPALLAVLAIDCIPLKLPSDGWRANYAAWVRLFIMMTAISLGLIEQIRDVIIRGTISNAGAVKVALGTASCYVAVSIAVAAAWTFPIPFGLVLMVWPYVFIFSSWAVLVIGPRVLLQSSLLRQQIKAQLLIVATQGVVAMAYPLFSAVFNRLTGFEQSVFVMVMPLIKFFTKQIIAAAAQSLHEHVGPIVVFSVDVYNVYYVAICMQSATSVLTTLLFVAADSFHLIVAIRTIFRQTRASEQDGSSGHHYFRDLPSIVRSTVQGAKPLHARSKPIRLFAPFPLPLTSESRNYMAEVEKLATETSDQSAVAIIRSGQTLDSKCELSSERIAKGLSRKPSLQKKSIPIVTVLQRHQVVPTNRDPDPPLRPVRLSKVAWKLSQRRARIMSSKGRMMSIPKPKPSYQHVQDELQALFHSEYVLMAEYIEFMLPTLYAFYLGILFHLPVAAYYPHTASLSLSKLQSTLIRILAFAAIEFLGFGGLLVLLKQKFGFSPLYQLAFVLETEIRTLQGHLFVWTPFILQMTLAHYGAPSFQWGYLVRS